MKGASLLATVMFVILAVMIVPVPTPLLDLAITFSLAFALTVLLVVLGTREPLELSVFPSLLLVVTLARLALNVASTRLILADGWAGNVIASFGEFVVAGNPVIGLVIFSILVVIQFVVITKGAGRVAEVAARFTLDGMPGKQMAIDADLGSGLIDEAEARTRRERVAREADFYGAMDGASKFVRGDAVAGVVITLVNIVGGFVVGVAQRGLAFGDALRTYTLLTVGDGLVTQIPALVVSVAAGILVTRAAGRRDLGDDLLRQVVLRPPAVLATAAMLALLGLVPGLPAVPFLVLAAAAALLGIAGARRAPAREAEGDAPGTTPTDRFEDLLAVEPLEVEIGSELVPLADANAGGTLPGLLAATRRRIAAELGFVAPPARVRDSTRLGPREYRILVKGVPVARFEIEPDRVLVLDPKADDGLRGIAVRDPAFGRPAAWISRDAVAAAPRPDRTIIEPAAVIATHLDEIVRDAAPELLGRQETRELVESVRDRAPAVVDEVLPGKLELGGIQRVLAGLLRERVSVRDLVTILETLADHAAGASGADELVEHCRAALGRAICDAHRNPDGTVTAVTLSPRVEHLLDGSRLAPRVRRSLLDATVARVDEAVASGRRPVLLTSARLRTALRSLVAPLLPHVPVLSVAEIATGVPVTSIGTVNLDDE